MPSLFFSLVQGGGGLVYRTTGGAGRSAVRPRRSGGREAADPASSPIHSTT